MTVQRRVLKGCIDPVMIEASSKWLNALGEEFGFAHEDIYRMDLCLEELVTNVVHYSDPQYAGQPMELRAVINPDILDIILIDSAAAYDPFSRPTPKVAESIEELQIGGQGVHLVREFSDAHRYDRIDDTNRVELAFKLTEPVARLGHTETVLRKTDRRQQENTDCPPVEEERRSSPDRRSNGFLSWAQLFCGVPYDDVERLVNRMTIMDVATEVLLLRTGVMSDSVMVVLQGQLNIFTGDLDATEHLVVTPGGCVAEMSVIDHKPVSAHVVGVPGTRLLVIDADTFLNHLLAMPRVSRNLLSAMADRMRRNNDLINQRVRLQMQMEHMQRELQYAKAIQESMLPHSPLLADESRLDCVGRMCTAREVGGDFYDVFCLNSRHVFFAIGDVCGKGLPAAMFMVRAVSALRGQASGSGKPGEYVGEAVNRLNEQLCTFNDSQQFLTAFCGVLDMETRKLHYVLAGHNPPLIALGNGPFQYVTDPSSLIVGMVGGVDYTVGEIDFPPGSTLFMYTDGVTEAEDTAGNMLGEERLIETINTLTSRSSHDVIEAIFADVDAFATGAPQADDITALAIRCCGG